MESAEKDYLPRETRILLGQDYKEMRSRCCQVLDNDLHVHKGIQIGKLKYICCDQNLYDKVTRIKDNPLNLFTINRLKALLVR